MCCGADNPTGLKPVTEAVALDIIVRWVGERSVSGEGRAGARLERAEVRMPV